MSNHRPKVSIGMPVYNGENYLQEALDCLLTQTFEDFELIISDNASTDRTQELMLEYARSDPRVVYKRNKTNIGASHNHNLVFSYARGEYFKWAGHDDRHEPRYLERCVQALDQHPDVVLCYPWTIVIDGNGEVTQYYKDGLDLLSDKPHERYRRILDHSPHKMLNPALGLIRTEVLKLNQLEGPYFASDRVVLAELALYGKFYEVPEYLFHRRLHSGNSTTANPTGKAMAIWSDPLARGKMAIPRWQRMLGNFNAIRRTRMRWRAKMLCYSEFFSFYFSLKRFGGLRTELQEISKGLGSKKEG